MAPSTEIDDIFAFKGKGKAVQLPTPSSSVQTPDKPKKDKKKRKRAADAEVSGEGSHTTKRRLPETVLDPSAHLSVPVSKKSAKAEKTADASKKKRKVEQEAEERFKDSRGTGSRRTTEEGFAIYKEGELGITDGGGDTPLCPFDCQCCF